MKELPNYFADSMSYGNCSNVLTAEGYVRWVPCHHGMARPQVADGGKVSRYGGQLRIYSISSRGQPRRVGPPAWELGVVLTTPHRNKIICCKMFQSASDLD
jgi:hypothetical protein